ncbi:hypothetical protein BV898_08256 [Hypsibius exemplaris]|uniref:Uncharacterized protein n=1 Tax=Hypsibius exemplaris TaxID=2072580 RepID=A0A1W0WR21_HYPEX|nr:hypothetical protein BV898_08256 [Hypsibius exemplaris]
MPALRPYCHPPYKHQASNYEFRMRKLRQTLQSRALNISAALKKLDDNDRAVVEMAINLKRYENEGKFKWIDNAINDLQKTSAKLEPGITRDRVEELVKVCQWI